MEALKTTKGIKEKNMNIKLTFERKYATIKKGKERVQIWN